MCPTTLSPTDGRVYGRDGYAGAIPLVSFSPHWIADQPGCAMTKREGALRWFDSILACSLVLISLAAAWFLGGDEFFTERRLLAEGRRLAEAIEVFRVQNGSLPIVLEELDPVERPPVGWEYHPRADGSTFDLVWGDYRQDGFVISYAGEEAQWYVDS